MNIFGPWSIVVRICAVGGIALAPIFALGSYFVARNIPELLFAAGQLLMIVPLWRMYSHRLWAGILVCHVGLFVCGCWLLHWQEFDLPIKYPVFALAFLPTILLIRGRGAWGRGF